MESGDWEVRSAKCEVGSGQRAVGNPMFPSSAWEHTVREAPPRGITNKSISSQSSSETEPPKQCIPRQSLGTSKPISHYPLPTSYFPLPTSHSARSNFFALAFSLLSLVGCSWSPPAEFGLNTEGRDPQSISKSQRESIGQTLEKLFGTPDRPEAPDGVGLDQGLLAIAAGPVGSDENDNPRGLFRKHCVACHGVSGDGAGPSAAALMPYPRDYRQGLFKYTSTAGGGKPVREDLLRTLRSGIPGTAMPSFGKLPERQIESLVEYVKYLSIRGETELYLVAQVVDEDETLDPAKASDLVEEAVTPIAKSWDAADSLRVTAPPPPATDTPELLAASLAAGKAIFNSTGAVFQMPRARGSRQWRAAAALRRVEQDESRSVARRNPPAGREFPVAARGAQAAEFHGGHISRGRPAGGSILSDIGRDQRHADAAGRPRSGEQRHPFAGGHLARRELRSLVGKLAEREVEWAWALGLRSWISSAFWRATPTLQMAV